MSFLSQKQKTDLNNSILNYLKPLVSTDVLNNLQNELNITDIQDDNDLLIKKWNAIIRLQKKILDLESQVNQLSKQSTNSSYLQIASFTNSDLIKLNWAPSKVKKTLNNEHSVTSVAIHPMQPQLFTGLSDGSFLQWNLLDLVQPLNIIHAHTKSLNQLVISPDRLDFNNKNHVIVTCGSDLYVKVWDATSCKLLRTLTGHEHVVSSIVFKKNSRYIFTCSRDQTIKLWDLTNGWCIKSFIGHSDWVRTLDLTAGEYLLSGSNDQSIRLSHGDSGTGLGIMIGHGQVIETVKFIPIRSNKYVDKLNQLDYPIDDETYNKIGFKYAVSGGRDDTIKIWLLPLPIIRPHNHPIPSSNPQGILIKTLIGHKSWVKDLEFHPNGKILISCSDDKSIKFWDLENGDCIRTLQEHQGFINSINWAPSIFENPDDRSTNDEKLIDENMRCLFVSGGTDQTVKVWE
ncbi:putative WD repeat-containing protein [Wickerhamomyces ciferrii]|uniref:Nuclear distribution protein PAC1 n=1 Tax=Wickerhamomyces ciferrii (strain ATCC 14091 / BCRC 22168 / CBS 111 / JCM 3599 / NBRC 0793 / NRRL Y-1031 F-60-10) TaxID=1206466 RepID=K0K6C6_WICCF|nr:putative WD repeat-containing protein [Wickerhamomyces ciferrii]CCH40495.1 putative WD repeat-containing protein [Wickerhamomyces ciferrii]